MVLHPYKQSARRKSLKAIISIGATVDRYNDDIHYKNGCLLNENFGWGTSLTAFTTPTIDPLTVGEKWRSIRKSKFFAVIFKHQTRDAYWEHGSICENFDDIRIPVMIVSGWNDLYVNALPALISNIATQYVAPGPNRCRSPGPSFDYLGASLAWWHQWLGP